jgi:hypothetical protein
MARVVTDGPAIRAALRGAERLFHVAGTTSLRLGEAEALRTNAVGRRAAGALLPGSAR